jgi:hypothetical protein
LERRRSRHPHPERSQGGVREAAVTSRPGLAPSCNQRLARRPRAPLTSEFVDFYSSAYVNEKSATRT